MSETQMALLIGAGLVILLLLLFRTNLKRITFKPLDIEASAEPRTPDPADPRGPGKAGHTGPVAVGERSAAAGGTGGHTLTTGDHASVSISNVNREMLDRSERLAEEKGGLRERLESECGEAHLRAQPGAALARDDAGDEAARAAIDEVRRTGDVARLQAVLLAEADREKITADYVALCREIAAVAFLRGDIAEAESLLKVILRFDPDDLDAINRMGHIHRLRGELAEAEGCYRLVLDKSGGDDAWRAVAYGNLGLIERTRGNLDAAEKYHKDALEIERKLGRLEGMANQYGNLGLIERTRGNLDAAEKYHKDALEINRKLGRLEGMATAYGNLGLIEQTRGNLDAAEKYHKDALEIERKLGRLEGMANQYGNLGLIKQTRGNVAGARELWLKARDLYAKVGMPHMVKRIQSWLDDLPPQGGAKPG